MKRVAPAIGVTVGIASIVVLILLRLRIVNAQSAAEDTTASPWLVLLILLGGIGLIVVCVAVASFLVSARVADVARKRSSNSLIVLSAIRPDLRAALKRAGVPSSRILGPVVFAVDDQSLRIVNRRGITIARWHRSDVRASALKFDTGTSVLDGISLMVPETEIAFVPRSARPLFTRIRDTAALVEELNTSQ